eukprot:203812-Chlamydomonas_euryale.AAC.6
MHQLALAGLVACTAEVAQQRSGAESRHQPAAAAGDRRQARERGGQPPLRRSPCAIARDVSPPGPPLERYDARTSAPPGFVHGLSTRCAAVHRRRRGLCSCTSRTRSPSGARRCSTTAEATRGGGRDDHARLAPPSAALCFAALCRAGLRRVDSARTYARRSWWQNTQRRRCPRFTVWLLLPRRRGEMLPQNWVRRKPSRVVRRGTGTRPGRPRRACARMASRQPGNQRCSAVARPPLSQEQFVAMLVLKKMWRGDAPLPKGPCKRTFGQPFAKHASRHAYMHNSHST